MKYSSNFGNVESNINFMTLLLDNALERFGLTPWHYNFHPTIMPLKKPFLQQTFFPTHYLFLNFFLFVTHAYTLQMWVIKYNLPEKWKRCQLRLPLALRWTLGGTWPSWCKVLPCPLTCWGCEVSWYRALLSTVWTLAQWSCHSAGLTIQNCV